MGKRSEAIKRVSLATKEKLKTNIRQSLVEIAQLVRQQNVAPNLATAAANEKAQDALINKHAQARLAIEKKLPEASRKELRIILQELTAQIKSLNYFNLENHVPAKTSAMTGAAPNNTYFSNSDNDDGPLDTIASTQTANSMIIADHPLYADWEAALAEVKAIRDEVRMVIGSPKRTLLGYNKNDMHVLSSIKAQFHALELLPVSVRLKKEIALLQNTVGHALQHKNPAIQKLLEKFQQKSAIALKIMEKLTKDYEASYQTVAVKVFPMDHSKTLIENYHQHKAAATSVITTNPRLQLAAGNSHTRYPSLHEKLKENQLRLATVSTSVGKIACVETIKSGVASSIIYDLPTEFDAKKIWENTCREILAPEIRAEYQIHPNLTEAHFSPVIKNIQNKIETGEIAADYSNLKQALQTELKNPNIKTGFAHPNQTAGLLAEKFKINNTANVQSKKHQGYLFPSDDWIKLSYSLLSNLSQLRPNETIHIKNAATREAVLAAILTGAVLGLKVENNSRYKNLIPAAQMQNMLAAYKSLLSEKKIEFGDLHNPQNEVHPEETLKTLAKTQNKLRNF